MYEPLKGKIKSRKYADLSVVECVDLKPLKSGVKGLIKYHENNIDDLMMIVKKINDEETKEDYLYDIKREYNSIMAIELWLKYAIFRR